jgi:hypothetical protein
MTDMTPEWDTWIQHAPESDSHLRRINSWIPPVQELVWRTARASTLVRFYPSPGHSSLRLVTTSDFETAEELGPRIAYLFDNYASPDRRPEYWVWDILPKNRLLKPVLRTYDVHAAVRELERLTAGFAPA